MYWGAIWSLLSTMFGRDFSRLALLHEGNRRALPLITLRSTALTGLRHAEMLEVNGRGERSMPQAPV